MSWSAKVFRALWGLGEKRQRVKELGLTESFRAEAPSLRRALLVVAGE